MHRQRTYKPRRHLRYEVYSLLAVMIAPVAISIIFPYQAIGWKGSPGRPEQKPHCAIITLSESDALAAVETARSDIKTSVEGTATIWADLSISEIPEMVEGVADISERAAIANSKRIIQGELPLPMTLAAPKAHKIDRQYDNLKNNNAFSLEQMLDVNL